MVEIKPSEDEILVEVMSRIYGSINELAVTVMHISGLHPKDPGALELAKEFVTRLTEVAEWATDEASRLACENKGVPYTKPPRKENPGRDPEIIKRAVSRAAKRRGVKIKKP